jgi:sporulation integral membrane protein YtvI
LVITKKDLYNGIFLIVGLIVAYFVTRFVMPFLTPFILGFIFSLILEPIVRLLQRKTRISRGGAVAISLVTVFGVIVFIISLLAVQLTSELISLSGSLPKFFDKLAQIITVKWKSLFLYYEQLPPNIHAVVNQFTDELRNSLSDIAISLKDVTKNIANSLIATVSKLPNLLAIIIVALLATYFIGRDRNVILKLWYSTFPYSWADKVVRVLSNIIEALTGYFKAQMIIISITMVQAVIGLYLIGTDYALLKGLIIGFFDFLPVFGPGSVFLPLILWELVNGSVSMGMKIAILWLVIMVVRQLIEAKIVSATIGLHPLVTLISIYVGLKAYGFIGMVLGPIVVITLEALWKAGLFNYRLYK